MIKKVTIGLVGLLLFATLANPVLALEKLKFATPIRESPIYYLPMFAANEQGFARERGFEFEWVPMRGGGLVAQAFAARALSLGFNMGPSVIEVIAAAVPMVAVGELTYKSNFIFWVLPDSRFLKPQDLEGAKIGLTAFGGVSHAFGRLAVRALGLEKKVKFVGAGGIPQQIAALKVGSVDTIIQPISILINAKLKGEVREFMSTLDYLPKEWLDNVIVAEKDFIAKRPETVRTVVKVILQSLDFIRKNPSWAIEKMKPINGYSDEAARVIYEESLDRFTKDGKINKKAVENVINFMIEYGLITKEKAPAIEQFYWEGFSS